MNMGLALGMLGLTTFAVALLLAPLILRNRRNDTRDAYNLAVYRDQLAELERDVGRGIIEPGEAEAAKSEIGRRILALTPGEAPAACDAKGNRGETAAAAKPNPHLDMAEAIRKLKAHLKEQPGDFNSWVLLARSEMGQGRYQDAVEDYRHAADLSGQKPEIVGDWAEAEALAAGGKITPEAQEHFTTALADPENAPRSRYYLALAKLQAGDAKTALQEWVDLEADSPDDANWLPMLRRRSDETAPVSYT